MVYISLHTIFMKYNFIFKKQQLFFFIKKILLSWVKWNHVRIVFFCLCLHVVRRRCNWWWGILTVLTKKHKWIHAHTHIYIQRVRYEMKKLMLKNLHNEYFNIKRLMPYSCVTFCLLNIHHPGFGELNLPYEYEVIEKYIPAPSHDWYHREYRY